MRVHIIAAHDFGNQCKHQRTAKNRSAVIWQSVQRNALSPKIQGNCPSQHDCQEFNNAHAKEHEVYRNARRRDVVNTPFPILPHSSICSNVIHWRTVHGW